MPDQTKNLRENRKYTPYQYTVGEVLVTQDQEATNVSPYEGPCMTAVNNNGKVEDDMGIVSDTYTIRNIHPYRRKDPTKWTR